MDQSEINCPKCKQAMEEGFVVGGFAVAVEALCLCWGSSSSTARALQQRISMHLIGPKIRAAGEQKLCRPPRRHDDDQRISCLLAAGC